MSLSSPPNLPGNLAPPQLPAKNSPWRSAFRLFRWATYITSALTLILLLHKTAPPPVEAASPEAAARVDQKFAQVAQSLNSGQAATVHLDETEVNSYLASHLNLENSSAATATAPQGNSTNASNSAPNSSPAESPTQEDIERARSSVRDVKIQLIEDRVKAYILFDMHGKDMTLQLEGRIASSGGYLRFEPLGGEIGSLPIPQSALQSAVQRMMDSPVNRETLRLPPNISDLRAQNGEIVVTYQ
ncbi:MAG: hypothetical protein PVS2B2_19210 [Candidatus Acidiferrum sp.]